MVIVSHRHQRNQEEELQSTGLTVTGEMGYYSWHCEKIRRGFEIKAFVSACQSRSQWMNKGKKFKKQQVFNGAQPGHLGIPTFADFAVLDTIGCARILRGAEQLGHKMEIEMQSYPHQIISIKYSHCFHQAVFGRSVWQFWGRRMPTLLAPSASYVAFRDFHAWYFSASFH